MDQEIQTQPQQLNPVPPNNKNKIIIAVVGLLVITILVMLGYFVFSQSSVKPAETQNQQEPDVSTWQTYRNEVYGFEFKYPSTLRIKADGGGYFRLGKTKEVNETFLEIIYGEAGSNFDNTQAKYVSTILLDSIPARKYSAPEGICDGPDLCSPAAVQINITHETKEYALIFYGSADLTKEQQQILSTFKFTKLETTDASVDSLKPDAFEWCMANGGDNRTPNYNAPKVCVLNNKVYEESCVSNTKYFVIESNLTDSVGANHLVKFKTDANQNFVCEYKVEKGDFEIKNEWAEYTLALDNNFLILDSGTGPDPRGLIIYDLNLRKKVYEDSYSQPINIQNNTIDYWTGTTKPVTEQNCPDFKKWEEGGLGSAIDTHVSLNLLTLVKKELGEYRCSPRQ